MKLACILHAWAGNYDALFVRELRHRGTINAVHGHHLSIWTAGEQNVREWSATGGENSRTIDAFSIGHAGAVRCIRVISERLWCGRSDGSVTVFDAKTGQAAAHLKLHSEAIRSVAFAHGCIWVSACDQQVG